MLNDLANNFWQEEGGAPTRLLPKKELSDEGKLKLCQLILGFDAETEYKFPFHDPKIYKFLNSHRHIYCKISVTARFKVSNFTSGSINRKLYGDFVSLI